MGAKRKVMKLCPRCGSWDAIAERKREPSSYNPEHKITWTHTTCANCGFHDKGVVG